MIIDFSKTGFKAETGLRICRYRKKYNDDWMKNDGTKGRFHAKVITNKHVELHYDLYVEDRHFSPHVPIHLKKELHRILNILASMKKKLSTQGTI